MKLLAAATLVAICSARGHREAAASGTNGSVTKTFWDAYNSESYQSVVVRKHHGLKEAVVVRRDTGGPGEGDCSPYPPGAAPLPKSDTPEAFVANNDYHEFANEAQTPEGYDLVFQNYNGTVESLSYLGVWNMYDYDPDVCAEVCHEEPGCKSFNIYISRDPSLDPGPGCPNPPAMANYNCALYSDPINATLITNLGQERPPAGSDGNEFLVKLKASNGYVANGEVYDHYDPLIGYDGPHTLSAAINASDVDQGDGQLISVVGPYPEFKPAFCARSCDAASEKRKADATVDCLKKPSGVKRCTFYPCQYFNAYGLTDQNGTEHMYCALFDAEVPEDNATMAFTYDNDGNLLSVGDSWAYTRNPKQIDVVPGPADPYSVPAVNRVNPDEPSDDEPTSICATTTITQNTGATATVTATMTEVHLKFLTVTKIGHVFTATLKEYTVVPTETATPAGGHHQARPQANEPRSGASGRNKYEGTDRSPCDKSVLRHLKKNFDAAAKGQFTRAWNDVLAMQHFSSDECETTPSCLKKKEEMRSQFFMEAEEAWHEVIHAMCVGDRPRQSHDAADSGHGEARLLPRDTFARLEKLNLHIRDEIQHNDDPVPNVDKDVRQKAVAAEEETHQKAKLRLQGFLDEQLEKAWGEYLLKKNISPGKCIQLRDCRYARGDLKREYQLRFEATWALLDNAWKERMHEQYDYPEGTRLVKREGQDSFPYRDQALTDDDWITWCRNRSWTERHKIMAEMAF